jgi:phosphatidylethanolamine-binding protein (PEBP) family uncharacterized protein
MRRQTHAVLSSTVLAALVLAGCGSSTPKSVNISFKSPAVINGALPARYTCDGQNISPPMEWGKVPSTSKELAVFILGLTPVGSTGRYTTSVEWAMAGLNPSLHKLAAGQLPSGAHLALGRSGKQKPYSVCPPRGRPKRYQFALYAIPATVTVPPDFVGIRLLEVVANPKSSYAAYAGGAFAASYTRPAHINRRHAGSATG